MNQIINQTSYINEELILENINQNDDLESLIYTMIDACPYDFELIPTIASFKYLSYFDQINEFKNEMKYKINQYKKSIECRFFDENDAPKTVDIIFVTADKGLCGGFNIQTIKAVRNLLAEYGSQKVTVRLRAVGRKGIAFFNFQGVELLTSYAGVSSSPSYEKAQEIIKSAIDDFVEGKTDKVILVHNGYKNMISQELKIVDVVPVQSPIESRETSSLMELEPDESGEEILDSLLQKYFEYNMYYALIDSLAAEHSARMQAMDNATNNAKERVGVLTLAYNKARQESITTELIEIISGVESMK